ncbi:MAG: RES family NAD+ phosphorylase [Nakamurella sp.]
MTSAPSHSALIGDWPVEHADHGTWPPGGALLHCHRREWEPDSFNGSENAEVRFSPIRRRPAGAAAGSSATEVVPAWYGGSTAECAVAESLFHDVPVATGGELAPDRYLHRRVSIIRPTRALRLLRLDLDGVRALALDRWVFDCEAHEYRRTEELAQRLYDSHPDIDGLVWMSKRRNTDTAVVLYEAGGDGTHTGGIRPGDIEPDPHPVRDFDDADDWDWLFLYGESIRIEVR